MARKPAIKQFSFAGGEISPKLFGRTDLERYRQSMQACRNFIVEQTGVATNRPGWKYIGEVKDSSKLTVLKPFTALSGQAYALEFGDYYMRVHTLGGTVLYSSSDMGTHTAANDQTDMTDSSKYWQVGQWVGATITNVTTGATGTVSSNTENTIVATMSGGGAEDEDWDTDDEYTLALSSPGIFEIATPFPESSLRKVRHAQQNDVLVLVHPDIHPQLLSRYGESDWRMTQLLSTKAVTPPTIVSAPTPNGGTDYTPSDWAYVVTAIDRNGQESLPSAPYFVTQARFADQPFELVIFNPGSGGYSAAGYNIYISTGNLSTSVTDGWYGFIGYKEHQGAAGAQQTWEDQYRTPDYSDGPPTQRDPFETVVQSVEQGAQETQPFVGGPADFTGGDAEGTLGYLDQYTYRCQVWLDPGEFVEYELYARGDVGNPWVLLKTKRVENTGAETAFFAMHDSEVITDSMLADDGSWNNAFKRWRVLLIDSSPAVDTFAANFTYWDIGVATESTIDTYPSTVCFHDQRLLFGGFKHNSQLITLSKVGDFYNFDQGLFVQESDSFDLVLASSTLDAIKHLVPGDTLMVMTSGGEWVARGVDGGPLTPASFDLKRKTAFGSGDAQAITVGDSVVFATDRSRRVREFLPDPSAQGGLTRELSVMAEHLFRDYTINEFQYADVPFQVVWMPRSDGVLIGLTYVREHNVYAWHRHDTGGVYTDGIPRDTFESVAVVPEGAEASVYAIVKRTMPGVNGGSPVRYIELQAERRFIDQEDGLFLDSALTYDGRNAGSTQIKLKAYTGTHDTPDDSATLEISPSPAFTADEWAGDTISNDTDGSSGLISTNGVDSITAALSGGDNDWDIGDVWTITPTWAAQKKVLLESDTASTFVAGDVGKQFELRRRVLGTAQDENGQLSITDYSVRVTVTRFISDQLVEVAPETAVPSQLQTYYTSSWGRAENSFSGLDHLEGETIGVLVDGGTHQTVTVSSGAIALDSGIFAERLHAGIPYVSELVSMPLDVAQDEGSLRLSKKIISGVGCEVDSYRGLYVGHKRANLVAAQQRSVADNYETISDENEIILVRPKSTYSRSVNLIVQQRDPLPVTIMSLIVEIEIGGNQ